MELGGLLIMPEEIMDNPINYRQLVWPGITAIFTMLIGVSIITIVDGYTIRAIIVFIPISIFIFIFSGCLWECIRRPKTVVINEKGMILKMRYGRKQEHVIWQDIKYINIFVIAEGPFKGRDGYLYYGNSIRRTLYRPIALAARERYMDIMGIYPSMHPGYEQ
jgi:hypothetical protein